jgi:hypothetical protein
MLVALILAAFGVATMPSTASPDLTIWIVVLGIQAIPYACALFVSLVSALALPASLVGCDYQEYVERGPNPDLATDAASGVVAATR